MAQALLHGPQRAVPGRDEDHAGGVEARTGQRRRVQVAAGRDPQHRPGTAGQDAGDEQRRGGAVLDGGAAREQLGSSQDWGW